MKNSFIIILVSIFLIPLISLQRISADSNGRVETKVLTGKIIEIRNESDSENQEINLRTYIIEITEDGEKKTVESTDRNPLNEQENIFTIGDRVVVEKLTIEGIDEFYQITDFVRTTPLAVLFIIFILITVLVARKKGILSLIGLLISFLIIFMIVLPGMLNGADPLVITIASSLLIIPVNFYLAHGFNRKTTYAVVSTFITLIVTGILSLIFVQWTRLSGFTSDEAGFLNAITDGAINIKDLLLAGIIIGALGILDDITVSQSSIARQLKATNPKIKFEELFFRTMEVGKDHIASLVNTLILVYTSAALPLLLLFINNSETLLTTINREVIAEEIVRTLLASIGLILAVPLSTFISAFFTAREDNIEAEENHNHSH